MELITNNQGLIVKAIKPKATMDAADRFAALLEEQQQPEGFRKPCKIWQGSDKFRVDEATVTTPRTFALKLRGVVMPKGARVRILCKVVGCCEHIEPVI